MPFGTLLILATGGIVAYAVLRAAGLRGRTLSGYALALAPGIGFGAASLLFFGTRALGLAPPGIVTYLVLAGILSGGAWVLRARTPVLEHLHRARCLSGPWVVVAACLLLSATFWGVGRTHRTTAECLPDGRWDAVAIWNVHARVLYRGREQARELFSKLDARRGQADYPLMVPGAVAAQWALAGAESPREPRAMALAFTLGLGAVAFMVAGRAGGLGVGALAAGLVLSSPSTLQWGFSQGADVVVAYFLLAALSVLSLESRDRIPAAGLGGFLLGLLAWTKNEATVVALFLAVLVLSAKWKTPRRWRFSISVVMGFVPAAVALAVFKLTWAPTTGVEHFLGDAWSRISVLDRWIVPLRELGLRIVTPWSNTNVWELWGLTWPLAGIGGLTAFATLHHRTENRYGLWAGAVLGLLFVVWFVYVITPYPYVWHVRSSLDRILFQIFPTVVVGLVSRLAVVLEESNP